MNVPHLPESAEVAKQSVSMDPHALHARFLEILPRIETHARIRFRHLRCPGRRDDAIAEVVAVCWKWYLRLVARGKDVDEFVGTLADYAVRHVRSGRKLCGQEKARDAMSSLAQQHHGFRVEALECSTRRDFGALYAAPRGQDYQDAYEERLEDNTTTPPADQAAFRIDYPAWLDRLGEARSRDRRGHDAGTRPPRARRQAPGQPRPDQPAPTRVPRRLAALLRRSRRLLSHFTLLYSQGQHGVHHELSQ
jgi:hypothetical protein